MCTAVSFKSKNHYFGRNLDVEKSYGEKVVITPRNYIFNMKKCSYPESHYALIGMGVEVDGYPLYFEATNEKGLSMAGLNFPGNAYYSAYADGKVNVTPFEFIPWLLGQCRDIQEAREMLSGVNIVNIPFSEKLPLSPLHWIVSDSRESLTVESVKEGVRVYENPFGVLTNNPTFDYHSMNVNNYMHLYEGKAENRISDKADLCNYSLGMGALGLPGDFSSASRFVKAFFVKEKSVSAETETENVSQFFHILSSVAMPKGCVMTDEGKYEYTRYSCCCNTDRCVYYYNTYDDLSVRSVDMYSADIDGNRVILL